MPITLVPTKHTNLVRSERTGTFYLQAKVSGRVHRLNLHTNMERVALIRLGERLKALRAQSDAAASRLGCGLISECVERFLAQSTSNQSLQPRTRDYHTESVALIRATWPGFDQLDAGKISEHDCTEWAKSFRERVTRRGTTTSPTRFNGTVDVLRGLFRVAVDLGYCVSNPALKIERIPIKSRVPRLPSSSDFARLLTYLDTPKLSPRGKPLRQRCSQAATLVRFLAFSGLRVNESRHVTAKDVDFERSQLRVRTTKNGEPRVVPLNEDLRALLEVLVKKSKNPDAPLLPVGTAKKALAAACAALSLPHLSHHDLRHLFATRCIESGVDIPTVARWLGHKDGGALAMKVYGHLRDEHSRAMAARVSFA